MNRINNLIANPPKFSKLKIKEITFSSGHSSLHPTDIASNPDFDAEMKPVTFSSSYIRFNYRQDLVNNYLKKLNKTTELQLVNVSSTYPLNYTFAIDGDFVYFHYNIDRPSKLEMNFDLQIKPILDFEIDNGQVLHRRFQHTPKVEPLSFPIHHLLELPVRNSSLKEIILAKKQILKYFSTNLWRKKGEENDHVVIAYILPDPNNANDFIVGLGSEHKEGFLMKRLLAEARSRCAKNALAVLASFSKMVDLEVDFCRSRSHLVNWVRPEATNSSTEVYPPYQLNITFDALVYDEADKQAVANRRLLIARSRANAGLITGSLIGFTLLNFVISNAFWIAVISLSIIINTAFTIIFVSFTC